MRGARRAAVDARGLAGLGDLIVTCTSNHSRNRRAGILIGKGLKAKEAMAQVAPLWKGTTRRRRRTKLSKKAGIDMRSPRRFTRYLQRQVRD